MCYYNGIKVTRDEYIRLTGLEKEIKILFKLLAKPIQSGFEYKNWPIVRPAQTECGLEIVEAHWEFIPPWLNTWEEVVASRKKFTTLNAIGEELLEKRMYKDAALKRRCLVLSSGFYEWRHFQPKWSKKDIAYPYYINLPGKEYFFMEGIWQPWTDKSTGETIDTFAVVTTKANSLIAQVHDKKKRMPTILPDPLAFEWMQEGLSPDRVRELATYQYPSDKMAAYTIHKDFRALEDPISPFIYEELPSLK